MKIKLFGIKICISYWFVVIITIMLFSDRSGLVLPTICFALLHEAGHLIAMKILNCKPGEIVLSPGKIEIKNNAFCGLAGEALILLSGPLINLIFSSVFYIIFCIFGSDIPLIWSAVSLVMAVYNMLPITGLDGGRILYLLLNLLFGIKTAEVVVKTVSFLTAILILCYGIYSLHTQNDNLSLLIFGCYLLILYVVKR